MTNPIVTLLNPKALVLAFAIVPALAAGKWVASLPYLFGLSLLIVGCGFAWLALGAIGGPIMRLEPSVIRRSGAVVLLMFAALLGWSAFARLWQ